MNRRIGERLSGWLDDDDESPLHREDIARADAVQVDVAQDQVSSNETNAAVAESLLVHGLLVDVGCRDADSRVDRIGTVMRRIELESAKAAVDDAADVTRSNEGVRGFPLILKSFATVLSIAAALTVMFILLGPQQRVSAAMASLEQVVEAAMRPLDRTYRVRVVKEYARDKRPRNLSKSAWDRIAPEQIDGATIYVRGPNEYVMTALLNTGVTRTSGCDGKLSWSFREDGPVRVSADLDRFRGGMPGNKQDMPFLNIHAHLTQLRVGYDIELNDSYEVAADDTPLSQLTCVRKSADVRGIKRVELWFDPSNGTVHKMLLDGLPRGRGGPQSVTLELIDQSELGPDFFSHSSHHEPHRTVKSE